MAGSLFGRDSLGMVGAKESDMDAGMSGEGEWRGVKEAEEERTCCVSVDGVCSGIMYAERGEGRLKGS